MSARFQAPRGTSDILPAEQDARRRVHLACVELFGRAGYGRIETPIFEDTELFSRGVGASTDVVQKEMFTFTDQGDRSLTLRPEGTAAIVRAYVEHGMHKLPQPVKLWHWGPYFRHERPQAGRYRQFNQIGAEVIGTDSPLADVELILLLGDLFRELGVPGLTLRLSSLGSPDSRAAHREELIAYLRAHEAELAPDVRERIEENPLRAFDSKDEGTRAVMAAAPQLVDRLDEADAEHFGEVRRLLDHAGVPYELDGTLVRGLDYYTRTVFEFESESLDAQAATLGGGGRYDGLVEALGGPAAAGCGWAAGIERILLALESPPAEPSADVFVTAPAAHSERAFALVRELRGAGLHAELDLAGRSLKGQMKQADRIGARRAVIIDDEGGAEVRDMSSGEQQALDLARAVEVLKS
ncbi:MAG: histidyl-tRNA synthetase [Solirubrobacterales bacterium]|nr:histidyl-tRNA synthetase [Solirubrobacterales bacterium]